MSENTFRKVEEALIRRSNEMSQKSVCINCWEWFPEEFEYGITLSESNLSCCFCSLTCLIEWANKLLEKQQT